MKLCAGYGLLCAMLFVYNGLIWAAYAAFAAKVEIRLQKKMFEKMLSLPLKRIDSRSSGEWITRLNLVLELKALGFSLDEIKMIIDGKTAKRCGYKNSLYFFKNPPVYTDIKI